MKTKNLWWFLILVTMNMAQCQTKDFKEKLESMYEFTVPFITSKELARETKKGKAPVLLDIRSEEEYNVSHLRGAKFIDYEQFSESDVEGIPKDTDIVIYCSVGYRSEKIGEKLLDMGYTKVRNLYGGIFQWKNEGHSVVNNQSVETDSVHAYNKVWGVWLKKGVKVY